MKSDADGDVEREVLAGGRGGERASDGPEKERQRAQAQECGRPAGPAVGRAGGRARSAHGLQAAVALTMVSLDLESSFRISANGAASAVAVNGATTTDGQCWKTAEFHHSHRQQQLRRSRAAATAGSVKIPIH